MSTRAASLVLILLLLPSAIGAADFVGSGEEPEPQDLHIKSPSADAKNPSAKAPALVPIEESSPSPKPLIPLDLEDPVTPKRSIGVAMAGPEGQDPAQKPPAGEDTPNGETASLESAPPPASTEASTVAPILDDLTADLPTARKQERKSPFFVVFSDFETPQNASPISKKAFDLTAQMKSTVYQIADDLDSGGKAKTQLITLTVRLSKCINEAVELWPKDEDYRNVCRVAKSRALGLEEELREEPRKWTHVRWAFRALQEEVGKLRKHMVAMVEGSPQALMVIDKDGKEITVEVPVDPKVVESENEARKVRELERQKEQLHDEADSKKKEQGKLQFGD